MPSLLVSDATCPVPELLNDSILRISKAAIEERGIFTIALSGGSLASFLAGLSDAPQDTKFDCWHVILADERCVPLSDADSNLGALSEKFLSKVPIPKEQIYGINQEKIHEPSAEMAQDYEVVVRQVLHKSKGLDLAVLGFGPDGHTCSLFPGHPLLEENSKWVASIEDSPKPPPKRITLTFPVLNNETKNVIFCGAGASKSPILKAVFASVRSSSSLAADNGGQWYELTMATPPPFPCAMVRPDLSSSTNAVTWIVDQAAMEGVAIEN